MLGYGYGGEPGRLGPVAVRDEALHGADPRPPPAAVEPRGAFAVWIPGPRIGAIVPALEAGLRLEPFPVLCAGTGPFADFTRYLPISPGLL